MEKITIERPSEETLQKLGVRSWPTWERETSSFPWHYGERETCYIIKGKVRVEPMGGDAVEFGAGDLVTFPKGMDCNWTILEPVRKYYKFG